MPVKSLAVVLLIDCGTYKGEFLVKSPTNPSIIIGSADLDGIDGGKIVGRDVVNQQKIMFQN